MDARRRVSGVLDRLLEGIVAAVYGLTIVVMFIQVVLRYVFNEPFTWAEELSRYCFIWIVYLGAAIASKRAAHLKVDYLAPYMPPKLRSTIHNIFLWGITAFLLLIFVKGIELAKNFLLAPSYTMEWLPQGLVYAVIPLGALLMTVNMWRAHLRKERQEALGPPKIEESL
jgi:TRAP-type C4-dicarboxylate transport system permease small subunit